MTMDFDLQLCTKYLIDTLIPVYDPACLLYTQKRNTKNRLIFVYTAHIKWLNKKHQLFKWCIKIISSVFNTKTF